MSAQAFNPGGAGRSTLAIPLAFLRRVPGAFVFPIPAGEKAAPIYEGYRTLATNEPGLIAAWHKAHPGCNWGLAPGKSHIIPMDLDTKPGKVGRDTLDLLELECGRLPTTLTVTTPSGGKHFYFRETAAAKYFQRLGKSGFGLDIDCPAYVVLPGCTLTTGGSYRVTTAAPLAAAPSWFAEFLKAKPRTAADPHIPEIDLDKPENVARMVAYLSEGAPSSIQGHGGDAAMYQVIAVLKDNGISADTALDLIAAHYNRPPLYDIETGAAERPGCDPLWLIGNGPDADRLDRKIENVFRYGQNAPGTDTAEAHFATDPYTDPLPTTPIYPRRKTNSRRAARRRKARGFEPC